MPYVAEHMVSDRDNPSSANAGPSPVDAVLAIVPVETSTPAQRRRQIHALVQTYSPLFFGPPIPLPDIGFDEITDLDRIAESVQFPYAVPAQPIALPDISRDTTDNDRLSDPEDFEPA